MFVTLNSTWSLLIQESNWLLYVNLHPSHLVIITCGFRSFLVDSFRFSVWQSMPSVKKNSFMSLFPDLHTFYFLFLSYWLPRANTILKSSYERDILALLLILVGKFQFFIIKYDVVLGFVGILFQVEKVPLYC